MTVKTSLLALILLFYAPISFAGRVKNVNAKKSIVLIDEGSKAGIKKGQKICFANKDKQIGCGVVSKTRSGSAVVKVKSSLIKKIKTGRTSTISASAYADAKGVKASPLQSRITGSYIMSLATPSTFNKISYVPPTATSSSMWESTGTAKLSLLGFGGEAAFGIGRLSLVLGGRMVLPKLGDKMISPKLTTLADYDSVATNYAEVVINSQDLGFSGDLYFIDSSFGSLYFLMGVGADFAMSSVTVTATQLSDVSDTALPIANLSSKKNIISLRVPMLFSLVTGPEGIGAGVQLLLPLAAMGQGSAVVDDKNAKEMGGLTPEQDLDLALGHTKSSFGLMITGAISILF